LLIVDTVVGGRGWAIGALWRCTRRIVDALVDRFGLDPQAALAIVIVVAVGDRRAVCRWYRARLRADGLV